MNIHKTDSTNLSIELLKKGDSQEFNKLVEGTSEKIYRMAYRMLGTEMEAEDILQETYLKALIGMKSFEARSSIQTWLYRIAMNEVFMHFRKNGRPLISLDEEIDGEDGEIEPVQIVDWCCLPESELMDKESQNFLTNAAHRLSPALLAVFTLRDIQGLSIQEAAEILQISESSVKVRLLRARLFLREQLSSYYSERMERRVDHAT